MTFSRLILVFLLAALFLAATNAIAFGQSGVNAHEKLLQTAINGSMFETTSGATIERYKYNHVIYERCSLSWTEEHESRKGNHVSLRELSENTVALDVLDVRAIRSEKLKASGFQVSLITKGLKPGFFSRQRLQWGDEPATESQSVSTGVAFYFADRAAADSVAQAIAVLARSCSRR
jgi:hypothetical protein